MNNKKESKHTRWIYIIAGVILLLIAFFAWTKFKYKFAHKKIHEIVAEKSKGLYSIHYDSLLIDETSGSASVNHVQLTPDTAFYRTMITEGKAPPVLVWLSADVMQVTGIKTPKALLTQEISGHRVEIDRPNIEIGINNFLKDTSGYSPGKDIYQQILGQLKRINIDSIIITNANVAVKDINTGKTKFIGKNVSLILSDLLIDSIQRDDSTRILFSKNLDLLCKEIVLHSKDKIYTYRFEKLEFISQVNRFNIGSISVSPGMTNEAFVNLHKFSKDVYHFDIKNISFININRKSLWEKRIEADSLLIKESSFKIYRDISKPHDSADRTKAFPQQQLMLVHVPLHIKKAVFGNSFIEYKEKNAKSDSSGKVQFANVHATLSNVTNMWTFIQKNNICRLDFNADFLHQAPLKVQLDMDLKSKDGGFSIEGTMGSMQGQKLNAMIVPMALARIEKGNIDKLDFMLRGSNHGAHGDLMILYDDIHLSLLKKNDKKNKYTKKLLPTLATEIVLKKSNPSGNDAPRKSNIQNNRDIHRSFFYLLWKTIFKGVKETAGIKK